MKVELLFITWVSPFNSAFWCYCAETWSQNLHQTNDPDTAVQDCLDKVKWELESRLKYKNLVKRGWVVNEEKITPPVVNEQEEITKLQKEHKLLGYPDNFNAYKTFKLIVDIPLPK